MKTLVFSASTAHLIHYFFEWAALLIGMQFYRWHKKQAGQGALLAPGNFALVAGCIAGAAIGNKAVFWIEYAHLFVQMAGNPVNWFVGQSLVGGLLGGLLGVEIAKKIVGVRVSTGDLFVFPILLGIVIGRVGCFLAGLHDGTFGLPANVPWALDFGDGIARHPTQLYEIVFVALLWPLLARMRPHLASQPGLLFKLMLAAYLIWRLLIDGIKPVPYPMWWGLSGIQIVCVLALLLYLPLLLNQLWQWQRQQMSPTQAREPRLKEN